MATSLIVYGSLDPINFKFSLAGVGVDPTLVLGDVKMSKDSGTPADVPLAQLAAIDAVNMTGAYKFTPLSADTSCKTLVINIKDQDGPAFDENMLVIDTGGNALARFSG